MLAFSSLFLAFLVAFWSSAALALKNGKITVDSEGNKLAYTDTGACSDSHYTTIIGVHGMSFNAGIFQKLQEIAPRSNVRFVGVTRRDYSGSTPFSNDELRIVQNGTETEKTQFLKKIGMEFNTFVDTFIQQNKLPAPTKDKKGGVIVLGWSLGSSVTLASVANLDAMSKDVQKRLASMIHTTILHEPGSNILGLPPAPNNWTPWNLVDPTIPVTKQIPFFAQWASGYMQHGDLSTRDPNVLEFFVPATFKRPTVFGMSQSQYKAIIEPNQPSQIDIPYQVNFVPQLLASYRKAIYDKPTRALLPKMTASYLGGEHTPGFGPWTVWSVQDDAKNFTKGLIDTKLISGINHISLWDDPETTLKEYLKTVKP